MVRKGAKEIKENVVRKGAKEIRETKGNVAKWDLLDLPEFLLEHPARS